MWLRLTQDLLLIVKRAASLGKPILIGENLMSKSRQKIDHVARARQAWKILRKRARKGNLITYGELSGRMGLHPRSARWFLGVIQEECRQQRLPPLQAIAVNKATGVPGIGYDATERQGKKYRKAVKQVHSRNWKEEAPF